MLTKYRIISLPFFTGTTYYLQNEAQGKLIRYNQKITCSTAKRLIAQGLKQPTFKWNGNVIIFFVDKKEKVLTNENDVLPEETERIEEILATLPVEYKGKGPYSENDMSKILDYFGVEDDVSEK